MDMNIDYTALLADAEKQYNLMHEVRARIDADEYSLTIHGTAVGDPRLTKLNYARIRAGAKYELWIQENITKRGIELHVDRFTCKPVGLSIVVAGRR